MTLDPSSLPPTWSIRRPKPVFQTIYDFLGAPLRMIALPDRASESLGLTSLRAERFAQVLPLLRGRVLDIGAHDNALLRLYRREAARLRVPQDQIDASVGVDVVDWGGGCRIVETCARLPFEDNAFDTVTVIAALNHIPDRLAVLKEARRMLQPDGQVVLTMIGPIVGAIGHVIWWYSEDKHREVADGEVMGMDVADVVQLLQVAGFHVTRRRRFGYGLNIVFVGQPTRQLTTGT